MVKQKINLIKNLFATNHKDMGVLKIREFSYARRLFFIRFSARPMKKLNLKTLIGLPIIGLNIIILCLNYTGLAGLLKADFIFFIPRIGILSMALSFFLILFYFKIPLLFHAYKLLVTEKVLKKKIVLYLRIIYILCVCLHLSVAFLVFFTQSNLCFNPETFGFLYKTGSTDHMYVFWITQNVIFAFSLNFFNFIKSKNLKLQLAVILLVYFLYAYGLFLDYGSILPKHLPITFSYNVIGFTEISFLDYTRFFYIAYFSTMLFAALFHNYVLNIDLKVRSFITFGIIFKNIIIPFLNFKGEISENALSSSGSSTQHTKSRPRLHNIKVRGMHRTKLFIGRAIKKYEAYDDALGCTPRHAVTLFTEMGKASGASASFIVGTSFAVVGLVGTIYNVGGFADAEPDVPEPPMEAPEITAEAMSKYLSKQSAKNQPAISDSIKTAIKLAEERAKTMK